MKKLLIIALVAGVAGFWSCGSDDSEEPASITKVAFAPATPTNNDNVTVTATIIGMPFVTSAAVQYKIGGGSYIAAPMSAGDDDVWTGTIPKQAARTVVSFHVEATNASATARSAEQSYTVAAAQ